MKWEQEANLSALSKYWGYLLLQHNPAYPAWSSKSYPPQLHGGNHSYYSAVRNSGAVWEVLLYGIKLGVMWILEAQLAFLEEHSFWILNGLNVIFSEVRGIYFLAFLYNDHGVLIIEMMWHILFLLFPSQMVNTIFGKHRVIIPTHTLVLFRSHITKPFSKFI